MRENKKLVVQQRRRRGYVNKKEKFKASLPITLEITMHSTR